MKSKETTTPYPIDEEATDCGENCSFEDGEDGVVVVLHPGWHGCQPVTVEAGPWLRPGTGGPLVRGQEGVLLRDLGQWLFITYLEGFRYWKNQYAGHRLR